MGWLSDLFSSGNSNSSRKGQALSSTHEAFSLPTASPTFNHHPDAFHADSLNTPDPESAVTPSYTYPPQGPGSYGYVPTSAGLSSRPTSLLPLHHDPMHTPLSPTAPYPPLSHTWNRLRAWLSREYPELGDTLNYGILPQDLAQIEAQFGFALPAVVRESYLAVDGQEAESAAGCSEGLFFGLTLLPLEDVLEEWRFWREVDDDPSTGANHLLREAMHSIPPTWVRKEYSQRGWIPLIADKAGNYIGVDLNPAEGGSVGQVIVFGRDFDTKVVLWRGDGPAGWAKWLASFVEELESGEGFEIGANNEADDNSEDDLGYESYFYDGSGRGQGDGGGDTGSGGGLRLIGEYRGWNVLEAWADRSLRKWHEAGVITDLSIVPQQELKDKDKVGLGVLDLKQSAAEVPIPVLAEIEPAATPKVALGNVTNTTGARPISTAVPTISVTKPPAPLPVGLPTASDIAQLPSPPESIHSAFDEDLEAGRRTMSEVSMPVSSAARSGVTSSLAPRVNTKETTPRSGLSPTPSPVQASKSPVTIPDLLSEASPAMETKPIAPTSPAPPQPTPLVEAESNASEDALLPTAEEKLEPETTIRLVGGGGTVGAADAENLEEVKSDPEADAMSVNSNTSEPTPAKGAKAHKKGKGSLASLKKLGHFGRKKDSASSLKEVVPASASSTST